MNIVVKILNKLNKLYYNIYNSQYYKFNNINNTVKFSTEFPGKVILLNTNNVSIGEGTVINRNTHINGGNGQVSIGKYCHLGMGLTVYAFNHRYKDATKIPYDNILEAKSVIIKDFVWLGANVTIVPGVTIGEGVVVGAGSVVTRNIPDYAIVGGNPASVIKYRNKETFVNLKNNKKFF